MYYITGLLKHLHWLLLSLRRTNFRRIIFYPAVNIHTMYSRYLNQSASEAIAIRSNIQIFPRTIVVVTGPVPNQIHSFDYFIYSLTILEHLVGRFVAVCLFYEINKL